MSVGWKLPEPDFEDTKSSFIVTFRKSKLTDEYLNRLDLNERQRRAIEYIKRHGRITNREYQELCNVSKATATRELKILMQKTIIKQEGEGRNTFYIPK